MPQENAVTFLENLNGVQLPGELGIVITILKFIFWAAAIFFFLHGIYLIIQLGMVGDKRDRWKEMFSRKAEHIHKGEFTSRWLSIEKRMKTMQEAEYKLAIIEADKLFDDLLRRMMYPGKDMGERMKNLNEDFLPSINRVWDAHKIRNYIAHSPDYHIDYSDAERAINNYKQAFKELQILD